MSPKIKMATKQIKRYTTSPVVKQTQVAMPPFKAIWSVEVRKTDDTRAGVGVQEPGLPLGW